MNRDQEYGSSSAKENRLNYDGKYGEFFIVWIVNILLTIVTFGIYIFWARTKIRKYVAYHFSTSNDRFEYNGTGMELLLGFLRALPLLIALSFASIVTQIFMAPLAIVTYLIIFYLILVAIYGALRYRLSRMTWRGIRGRLTGSAFRFGLEYFLRLALNIVTLGLTIPYTDIRISNIIVNNAYFGSTRFRFDGRPEPLLATNLLTLLLAIPTLGISRFWYRAALVRHRCAHTTINALRFKSTYTGAGVCVLELVNILIIALTLGLGISVAIQRRLKYFANNTSILGDIDTSGVLQSDEPMSTTGEGMAQVLDLDSGII